jgi:uncharacterized membrane protein YjjB (DUF3815 family)
MSHVPPDFLAKYVVDVVPPHPPRQTPSIHCSYGCTGKDGENWYVIIPAFFGVVFTFGVLLNMDKRQVPGCATTQAVAFVVSKYSPVIVGDDAATAVTAFAVGIAANIFAYIAKRPPYANVVSGILFLVPGSMGVRGAAAIIENDVVSATAFGSGMLLTALSITVGLSLAHAISQLFRGAKMWRRTYRWFLQPAINLSSIAGRPSLIGATITRMAGRQGRNNGVRNEIKNM